MPLYIYYSNITISVWETYLQLFGETINISTDAWYKCKLKIDWDSSKCKLIVGDTSTSALSFTKTTGSGFKQDISLEGGRFHVYIDEIKVNKESVTY